MPVYTIAIHVPIYVDGVQHFVISEWKRALELLRDSFDGAFDRFILIAPSRPAEGAEVILEPLGMEDGFDLRPSISLDGSKRAYWLGGDRRRWKTDVAAALDETDFAHTVIDNLYRPISLDALRLVQAHSIPHAFFLDTDIIEQHHQLVAAGLMRRGLDLTLHDRLYARLLRGAVARADIAFLKGQALMQRYGDVAANPKLFQDTSYHSREVVQEDVIEHRLAVRGTGALRLVYCGRLVARKGCDHAIRIVAEARAAGADITLDLIGDGPERSALEAEAVGQGEGIRFLGERPYGPELLQALADYDALLFSPVAEDTPRMIFDGYAAGLPLLAYDIPYVQERAAEEGATVLLPFGDIGASAKRVVETSGDSGRMAELTRAALRAGQSNATDVWYRRRADWTSEAFRRAS